MTTVLDAVVMVGMLLWRLMGDSLILERSWYSLYVHVLDATLPATGWCTGCCCLATWVTMMPRSKSGRSSINPKISHLKNIAHTHTHTHTRLTALWPGLPGSAGTRKVKPIWISLKQETVSGSWAICKSAPRSRQITTPAPHRNKSNNNRAETGVKEPVNKQH